MLSIADPGNGPCLEYSEPQAHEKDASTNTPAPMGSIRPDDPRWLGPTSSASPAKPKMTPKNTLEEGRCPPGRSQSINTIHSVTMATSNAVTPDGTVCSAQHTPPFPTNSKSTPVVEAVFQCWSVGLIPVFQRKMG